jgi:hypothetical protein
VIGFQTTHAFLYASVSITSPSVPALLCVPLNDGHEFSRGCCLAPRTTQPLFGVIGPKTGCASIA